MIKKLMLSSALLALLLGTGCAGRDAAPVDTMTSYDKQMTCDDIVFEVNKNNDKLVDTVRELEEAKGQNVAVGLVGAVLFWPALFALDLSDAEKIEIQALKDRNENLLRMGNARKCSDLPKLMSDEEILQAYRDETRKAQQDDLGIKQKKKPAESE
ncbi:hypothetical protein ACTL6U_15925 [Rhodovibrionaceae bacterium A322]